MHLLAAVTAAVAFGVASILQRVAARDDDAPGLRTPRQLLRQPLFLLGSALDAGAFVLAAYASAGLPLFVVEGILATTVGVTAVLAVVALGDHLPRRAGLAVLAMIVGLLILAGSAPATDSLAGSGHQLLVMVSPAVVGGLAWIARVGLPTKSARVVLAGLAGVCFAAWTVAARFTTATPLTLVARVALVVIGLLIYGAALGDGAVTAMTAVCLAAETVSAAAVGLARGDTARPGWGWAALAGCVLTVGGAVVAARRPPSPAPADVGPATAAVATPS